MKKIIFSFLAGLALVVSLNVSTFAADSTRTERQDMGTYTIVKVYDQDGQLVTTYIEND